MKRLFPLFLALSLLLGACAPTPRPKPNEITLHLTYIPNVQFAPFYVAIEKGFFAEEGINVKLNYGNESDLIALLGSNKEQFMIASGEQVLLARGKGLPVLSVGNWYRDYPVGVVALKSSGIEQIADLKGRKIGLPGLYGANYIGFEAMASAVGFKSGDYELSAIGFSQVEALISGQVDAAVVYVANEPTQLRSQSFELSLFRVSDVIPLVGNSLVTNEKTAGEQANLVKGMVRAMRRGIAFVVDRPDEAYQICLSYVDNLTADDSNQKAVLAESIKLWQNGAPDQAAQSKAWQNMEDTLIHLNLLKNPIDLSKAVRYDFEP